jgi:signal transduction histidine kinase
MSDSARPLSAAPPSPKGELRWYRSLYWRIAFGLIAFLALMLAAEAALFIWTSQRIAGTMPARSPRRLAVLVASDVGTALAANPSLDLEKYVSEQYAHIFQTFLVIMRDGRVASNHDDVDDDLLDEARAESRLSEFSRRGRFGGGPGGEPGGGRPDFREPPRRLIEPNGSIGPYRPAPNGQNAPGGPNGPDGPGDPNAPKDSGDPNAFGRERRGGGLRTPPFRGAEVAPIMIGGMPVGRIAVLPGAPAFREVLRELGPQMALVAGGVLSFGTLMIALVVFGPTRRRLKQVQDATERLGSGDIGARAPEDGGDEVAAVARSFNKMADELTNRARALEASDKARRQLLADVSHELMTPLTAMRGYIETLSMAAVKLDAPTRERYMSIVEEETHRLEHIIGDLLDLARLEGGGGTLRHEHVPVALLFDRLASRHEAELTKHDINLVTHIDDSAEYVTGDPDRLEQALQNLVANALRHTPDRGTVTVTATATDDRLYFAVRDTGPGIQPEHLPLIFDRFYKADASRKATTGSGLGLSIVKAIIERHGGTISARNDNGAVFEIVLPVRQPVQGSADA